MLTLFPWQEGAWQSLPGNRTLAHALLISGPQGIGKTVFAHRLGMRLVCEQGKACGVCRSCVFAGKGDHPDLMVIKAEEGKAEITVDHARALNAFLALTPHIAERRVSIIEAADQLNRSAANALLKTLEEPPAESFVVLVSHAPARLLPTIRSRCQQIPLHKPSRSEALGYLKARGVDEADAALKIAHGTPLRAEGLPKDALNTAFRLLETLEHLVKGVLDAATAGEGWQALDLAYGLSLFTGILSDSVRLATVGTLSEPFPGDWETRLRRLASQLDLQQLFTLWDEVLELHGLADAPLDRRLIWDKLFLRFEQLRAQ